MSLPFCGFHYQIFTELFLQVLKEAYCLFLFCCLCLRGRRLIFQNSDDTAVCGESSVTLQEMSKITATKPKRFGFDGL